MIKFKNGVTIEYNPKLTKTENGVLITNDKGLHLELTDAIWDYLNN
jgi:hypothetical protein